MPDFGAAERRMLSYFKRGVELFYKGSMYIVEEADKPTCSFEPNRRPATIASVTLL